MSLKSRIQDDMKDAMRAREPVRLGAIRMLQAAIKQCEVDARGERGADAGSGGAVGEPAGLDDAQVTAIVERLLKQRRDSIAQFEAAQRHDLVERERAEVDVLSQYLPEQAGDDEIDAAIRKAVDSTGAGGLADMGKVMGVLKQRLAGRADMAIVSAKVRQALSS